MRCTLIALTKLTSRAEYIYPNDEVSNGRPSADLQIVNVDLPQKESDRLDIVHKMFEVRLGGKLHKAPIGKNPQRVLDIGIGTYQPSPDFYSSLSQDLYR